jgi:hypothetical protein
MRAPKPIIREAGVSCPALSSACLAVLRCSALARWPYASSVPSRDKAKEGGIQPVEHQSGCEKVAVYFAGRIRAKFKIVKTLNPADPGLLHIAGRLCSVFGCAARGTLPARIEEQVLALLSNTA